MKLFVNRLTVLDFSYLHPDRGVLGESWQVGITLTGNLDEQGMVLDFADVKRQVKQTIDELFDHRLLVPSRYSGLTFDDQPKKTSLTFKLTNGELIQHTAPETATAFIDATEINEATVASAIMAKLQPLMPANVQAMDLHLTPEEIQDSWYQYSHGLKHHCGNCQRIAHGHRSRIQILRNGQRDPFLETEWAEKWRDIYIATREDLQEEIILDGVSYLRFSYTAEQGDFFLQIPKRSCDLMDKDSTVENIADHIAATLKQTHPADHIEVIAFEGIDKGAAAER